MTWDYRPQEPEVVELEDTSGRRPRWLAVLVVSLAVLLVATVGIVRMLRDQATLDVGKPVYVGRHIVEIDVTAHNRTDERLSMVPIRLDHAGLQIIGVQIPGGNPNPPLNHLPANVTQDELSPAEVERHRIGEELLVLPKDSTQFVLRWRVTDCAAAANGTVGTALQIGEYGSPAETVDLDLGPAAKMLPRVCSDRPNRGRPTVASPRLKTPSSVSILAYATVHNTGGRTLRYAGLAAPVRGLETVDDGSEGKRGSTAEKVLIRPGQQTRLRVVFHAQCSPQPAPAARLRLKFATVGTPRTETAPVHYGNRWPNASSWPPC